MPRNQKPQLYAGGYNSKLAEKLSQISIPPKVQCVQCHRHFMQIKFSQNQLNAYRQRVFANQDGATLPKCRTCVGAPADELTCHRCELTKGLTAFTKVQRRKPDTALCKDCQQEVDDVEPKIEDALQEQEILETQTLIGSHTLQNYDSLRGSLPTLKSRTEGSETNSAPTPTRVSNGELFWGGGNSSIAGESDDGVWTGQYSSGNRGDGPNGAPSVAASAVSTGTTGTAWDQLIKAGRPEQSYRARIGSSPDNGSAQISKQSGNWAKQGAAKPDQGALREAEKQREAQRKVQEQERARFEEEDSSDSDWEL